MKDTTILSTRKIGNVNFEFKEYGTVMNKNSNVLNKLPCKNERTARIRAGNAQICIG